MRATASGTADSLSPLMRFACALKGGLLSITPQELLLALQPSPLALTTARDLAYQRRLSSLEGRDLRTQSTKESMGGGKLVWAGSAMPHKLARSPSATLGIVMKFAR